MGGGGCPREPVSSFGRRGGERGGVWGTRASPGASGERGPARAGSGARRGAGSGARRGAGRGAGPGAGRGAGLRTRQAQAGSGRGGGGHGDGVRGPHGVRDVRRSRSGRGGGRARSRPGVMVAVTAALARPRDEAGLVMDDRHSHPTAGHSGRKEGHRDRGRPHRRNGSGDRHRVHDRPRRRRPPHARWPWPRAPVAGSGPEHSSPVAEHRRRHPATRMTNRWDPQPARHHREPRPQHPLASSADPRAAPARSARRVSPGTHRRPAPSHCPPRTAYTR